MLRVCHGIRHLGLTIEEKYSIENNNLNVPSSALSLNNNNHPILSQLISFNLIMCVRCDIYAIARILRCMPNLNRFNFLLAARMTTFLHYRKLFNGYVWENVVKHYVPCLSKFEFHMSIWKRFSKLNLDFIVNSFQYFVRKYPNWHIIIDRWRVVNETAEEFVILRTLNYSTSQSNVNVFIPYINSESYETQSTTIINDHHLFYSNIRVLRIYLTKTRPNVTWFSPLYKNINYLFVQIPTIDYSSLWNKLLNTAIFCETSDDDAQENVTYLSYFVDLSNIGELEFSSEFCIYQWNSIQFILQACPNVTGIRISTRLLILSKLIDNPSLIRIFKQIKRIKLIREKFYFPSNFTSKLVQRFPSLNDIELQVFSFDNCVSIINTFLTCLENLFHVKINYSQDTLLDDPFSRDYIIGKRQQSFPGNIIDEEKVIVKNNGEVVEIWLT